MRPVRLVLTALVAACVAQRRTVFASEEGGSDEPCHTVLDILVAAAEGGAALDGRNVTLGQGMSQSFLDFVATAGLEGYLDDPDLVATVWVPSDAAFALAAEQLGLSDTGRRDGAVAELESASLLFLNDTARTHISPDVVVEGLSGWSREVPTLLEGQELRIGPCVRGTALYALNKAVVTQERGIQACQAMIYPIDAVLLPSARLLEAQQTQLTPAADVSG